MENKDDLKKQFIKGLKLAYKRMVAFKREKNSPIIISKNGKIIELNANDIDLEK